MKTLKQFVNEVSVISNVGPDNNNTEWVEALEKLAPKYEAEIKKIFPSHWNVHVRLQNILGMVLSIHVSEPWKVTRHNAKALAEFMVHLSGGNPQRIPTKFQIENQVVRRPLKFRKITGKTPEDGLKKMVKWYKKNRDQMLEMAGEGVNESLLTESTFKNEWNGNVSISERPNAIIINKVKFDSNERLQGLHTRFLGAITTYAIQTGKIVAVTPANDFSHSKAKAIKVYKQYGFKSNKGKVINFEFQETMLFTPKKLIGESLLEEGISSSVLRQYLDTATWSSSEVEDADIRDMDKSVINQAKKDLNKFFKKAAKILKGKGYDETDVAHDFWLTRNGHGAGFWDGDYGDDGDALTDIADKFGEVNLYYGDDGKIYS